MRVSHNEYALAYNKTLQGKKIGIIIQRNYGISRKYNDLSTQITRQSEMANTSPRHMPVLGNVHPIKIENFDIFGDVISLHARAFYIIN